MVKIGGESLGRELLLLKDWFVALLPMLDKWSPSIIGLLSIIIAKSSLDHSKRSSLVKDSYGPILDEIKKNKRIEADSSTLLNFKSLEDLKSSYLYEAFNKNEQTLIDDILKKSEKINVFKKKAPSLVKRSIIKVINREMEESELNSIVGNIFIDQFPPSCEKEKHFFDFLFTNNPSYVKFVCEVGHTVLRKTIVPSDDSGFEEIEGKEFFCEDRKSLDSILEEIYGDLLPSYNYPSVHFYNKYRDEMIEQFKIESGYARYEKGYELLLDDMETLESHVQQSLKKLLIPNYRMKKFFRRY